VRHLVIFGSALLAAAGAIAAPQLISREGPETRARQILESARYLEAVAFLDRTHDRLVEDIVHITEIPAPPFKEAARGKAYLEMLRASGLVDLQTDAEGNVMGVRKGTGGPDAPLVAVAAHLDTVFPEGTDVRVKRSGTRLAAPGVGDDSRALAVLLAIIRAMDAAGIETKSDILFVGDVGEEGAGDLRGMRYLFQKGPYKDRIKTFLSIDGSGLGDDITYGGVGSRRYKAMFKGPGGHSYGAFGLVSPAFAMGNALARMSRVQVPSSPKTTFNAGVLGGGTSVNSIPFEAWAELDLRSESPAELKKLDETVSALMAEAVKEENAARSTAQGAITLDLELIGDRPSGETPRTSPLAQTAAAVIAGLGMRPQFQYSSTDSNIPMSLGIPALTLDSGGRGGRAHALDEWIDVEKSSSLAGIRSILAIVLAVAGAGAG
jgi:acetylornithine deacetylase/succinyl-diaminopimelate desuccinylase-like protein